MHTDLEGGALPDQVLRLASLVGAYLRGSPQSPFRIDDDFARFARIRHGMGPLLLAAATDGLEPETRTKLENQRHALARRQAVEALQMQLVNARFGSAGISWLILKGAPQARLLYGDASLRPSNDIDILVPPRDLTAAVATFRDLGWTMATSGGFLPQGVAFWLLRDVDLYAPGDVRIHLELHQRPMVAEPFGVTGADLFASIERNPFPAPALGPALAYYLFAHGAMSGWCRLKWLTDFAQVLVKLDDAGSAALLQRAGKRRTVASLAASVLLTTDVFGQFGTTPLAPWAEGYRGRTSVQKRRAMFWAALTCSDIKAAPITLRSASLRSHFLFHESPISRLQLLFTAPFSTMLRKASGLSHGAVARTGRT